MNDSWGPEGRPSEKTSLSKSFASRRIGGWADVSGGDTEALCLVFPKFANWQLT